MESPLIISDRPQPARHTGHLTIGCLIFARMDQIDFTGPYEVLSRIPDSTIQVLGGYGQQDLTEDEEVLSLIRDQAESGRIVFSVCTEALLCGAAGNWAAWDLLPYYGAVPTRSLLRGDATAPEIQLSIQYAPNTVFHSGTPETTSAEVVQMFHARYEEVKASREVEARRFANKLQIRVPESSRSES